MRNEPNWTPWITSGDWINALSHVKTYRKWLSTAEVRTRFWRQLVRLARMRRSDRLARAATCQKLSDLWNEAATGHRNWHMHAHDGQEIAIDMDAATLTVGLPEFRVESNTDSYFYKFVQDYKFEARRPDWITTTGIWL